LKIPKTAKIDKSAAWPNAVLLKKASPLLEEGVEVSAGPLSKESVLSFWCVDCGIEGHLTTQGTIKGALVSGIEAGALDINMDLAIGLYLGIEGNMSVSLKFSHDIAEVPLGGIKIAGLIQIGPQISMAIETGVKVGLENAKILAGATLGWKGAKAHVGWGDGEKTSARLVL
jgi:hypothetical protein